MPQERSLLCVGMGYSARQLGRLLGGRVLGRRAGGSPSGTATAWRVVGTTRSDAGRASLAAEGFGSLIMDRNQPLSAETLDGFDAILVSVPPDAQGDPVLDTMEEAFRSARRPQWIGYLSTSGVYGEAHGAWVDELTPPHPRQPRSILRLQAETRWLDLWRQSGRPVEVFRLAGIYGPGRSALDSVRAGRAHRIVKPGHVVSRIHVEDLARVLQAALDKPSAGTIYNVADDEPAPPQDVIAEACAVLGVEPPPEVPLEEASLSPMARSFYAETRRVWNGRIKGNLGIGLLYPSYREGLQALANQGGAKE